MTENALVKRVNNLPVRHTDSDFDDMASGGDWLPRLMLYSGSSNIVKAGDFPANNYGLTRSKDDTVNLGNEIDVLVLAWRPKAMRIDGDDISSYYDKETDEFKAAQAESSEKDSGCMYGPEFLVYLVKQGTFATFFMNSKSQRISAKKVRPYVARCEKPMEEAGKPATLKIEVIRKKFVWAVTVCVPCSTPITESELPSDEELAHELDRFENPPKDTREKADEGSSEKRER